MLVDDRPFAGLALQADRQPQQVDRCLREIFRSAAAQQRPRECRVVASGDIEFHDLERRTRSFPLEECEPCPAPGVNAAHSSLGRRDIEDDDVIRVMFENSFEIARWTASARPLMRPRIWSRSTSVVMA